MTDLQKQQVVVIATYDNKLIYGKPFIEFCDGKHVLPECISKYLTSMDWIHPVAMKVLDELIAESDNLAEYYNNLPLFSEEAREAKQMDKVENLNIGIRLSIIEKPINGEYIALFEAVYNGVKFLNQQKENPLREVTDTNVGEIN